MVETTRLTIIPLSYEQILKYIKADNSLEKELNIGPANIKVSQDLQEAFEQTIIPAVADSSKNYLYATLWTAISKQENKMVGDLCFAGQPNEAGEVEIGYGTHEEFQKKGFMTEAVGGMIEWAKIRPELTAIIASTNKDNPASWAVLVKNGFSKVGESGTLINWKRMLK